MSLEKIKSDIVNYKTINIFFCKQKKENDVINNDRIVSYASYNISLGNDAQISIFNIIDNNLENFSSKEILEYNQVGALDDTIEIAYIKDYPSVNTLLESFEIPTIGEIKSESINFLIYEVKVEGDE